MPSVPHPVYQTNFLSILSTVTHGTAFWIVLLSFLIIVLSYIAYRIFSAIVREEGEIDRSLHKTLFQVVVPKYSSSDQQDKPDRDLIAIFDDFLSTMGEIKGKPKKFQSVPYSVALEIVTNGNEISFYIAVPEQFETIVEKNIYGFYPASQVYKVEDYTIFQPNSAVHGTELLLAKNEILPIRTYKTFETDPLAIITNTLSKMEEGEGAAIQMVFSAANISSKQKRALHVAREMQKGKTFEQALRGKSEPKKEQDQNATAQSFTATQQHQEMIKALEEKASKVGFSVNIRLATASPNDIRAKQLLQELLGGFHQFSSGYLNSFSAAKVKMKKFMFDYTFRNFIPARTVFLNTEELASIFHFPSPSNKTPKIKWLSARTAPPPLELPRSSTEIVLGYNIYRGEHATVRFANTADRRRHLYIIGQTGTGKSGLLHELIRQDIEKGSGVAVIDPHGDLVEGLLGLIPENRIDDVIYFSPADMESPFGLNMLEYQTDEQKDFAVQEMIAIFYKLFGSDMVGPMFEHNMRNAMLTLMADPNDPGTIVEIPRIFTDDKFVQMKLQKVTDPVVRSFWEKEMAQTSEFHKSEMLGYLVSKVGRFVENEMMRNIIGQPRSSFNVADVMNNKKILLVNLSKGKTGEINSSLLGLILVAKIQMAAMARGNLPEDQRNDFFLYMDEFQNFSTDSIATILSEARKYRLDMIMAHQFIGQLDEKIKDAVFGNAGSLISFRVGTDDAQYLANHFAPVFSAADLINLNNYTTCIKLLVNGQVTTPFSLNTFPPKEGDKKLVDKIKEISRLKYGRDRRAVEQEIMMRSRLGN